MPVVLALLLLAGGAALATVARPTQQLTASLGSSGQAGAADVPLRVVSADLLASRPGPVQVVARGEGAVLVAAGDADDVAAWAQGAATSTVTAVGDDGTLTVTTAGGEQQVPDPAGSDLWTSQAVGTSSARLAVEDSGARTAVLVASDGTAPAPALLEVTWTHRPVPVAAWGLLVAGGLLLVLAVARAVRRGSRRRGAEQVVDLRDVVLTPDGGYATGEASPGAGDEVDAGRRPVPWLLDPEDPEAPGADGDDPAALRPRGRRRAGR